MQRKKFGPLRFRYRQVSVHTELDPKGKQTAFDSEQESVTCALE
jgi:hypothetical protein